MHLLNAIPFPPIIIILAYILDLIFGDPEKFPHPVRWIGRLIGLLENQIRRFADTPFKLKVGGVMLALVTVGLTYGIVLLILFITYKYVLPLFFVFASYVVWTSISIKSLKKEAKDVIEKLKSQGLEKARMQLSRIVGRDTKNLSREGVLKATVETVSENTSDGIIAPLFYLALGGPALMMAYKAINTLDSMVGYKNAKYRDFGWFSARLDDAANFIPARLTSVLIVCTSFILGYNWMRSFKVFMRDGKKHPSPNSGRPEAAVAGALGVALGGTMSYGGTVCEKPLIGEAAAPIDIEQAEASIRIMLWTAALMIFLTFIFRVAAIFIF